MLTGLECIKRLLLEARPAGVGLHGPAVLAELGQEVAAYFSVSDDSDRLDHAPKGSGDFRAKVAQFKTALVRGKREYSIDAKPCESKALLRQRLGSNKVQSWKRRVKAKAAG